MTKVLIVGAGGYGGLSAQALLSMLNKAAIESEMVSESDFVLTARPSVPDFPQFVTIKDEDAARGDWYQRFSGRKGKPPRY